MSTERRSGVTRRRLLQTASVAGVALAFGRGIHPVYAKPLSVPQGLIMLLTRFGMDVLLAHPPGFDLMEATVAAARKNASDSGARFEIVRKDFDGNDALLDRLMEMRDVHRASFAPVDLQEVGSPDRADQHFVVPIVVHVPRRGDRPAAVVARVGAVEPEAVGAVERRQTQRRAEARSPRRRRPAWSRARSCAPPRSSARWRGSAAATSAATASSSRNSA